MFGVYLAAGRQLWANHRPDHPPFPTRPVTIVVPYAPGGVSDTLTRLVAESLSQRWAQPVAIVNQPGAGGNIGGARVFQAAPDGYTLLAADAALLTINPSLFPSLPFDPKQFAPVALLADFPTVLAVSPQLKVDSVQELIGLAKAKPGTLTYATIGKGTVSHLTGVIFAQTTNTQVTNIPYAGTSAALLDIDAGRTDLIFASLGSLLNFYQNGKLKILAVSADRRLSSIPDVPTFREAGLTEIPSNWLALVAPPKTPDLTAEHINWSVRDILGTSDIRARYAQLGAEAHVTTQRGLAELVTAESAVWGATIKAAGINLN